MLDFSSALYLGWHHPSDSLGAWPALSLGKPAALEAVPGSRAVARSIAKLTGCESASVCSSTLHLFWDLFAQLARQPSMILLDQATYPVLGWGVARAHQLGSQVQRFAAHDAGSAARLASQALARGLRPIIVTEGYAPSLSRCAPLREYAAIVRAGDGLLIVDDTQAIGLFGRFAQNSQPWGQGGGGSLQAQQVFGPEIMVGSSLAKAFGAPLAVLCASRAQIAAFESASQTRLHASPPNVAAIRAAQLALHYNAQQGEARRARLWALLQHWWRGLARLGLRSNGGLFPLQTLAAQEQVDWPSLHMYLLCRGIRAVLQQHRTATQMRWQLSFILNAGHSLSQLDRVLSCLATWMASRQMTRTISGTTSRSRYERNLGSNAL